MFGIHFLSRVRDDGLQLPGHECSLQNWLPIRDDDDDPHDWRAATKCLLVIETHWESIFACFNFFNCISHYPDVLDMHKHLQETQETMVSYEFWSVLQLFPSSLCSTFWLVKSRLRWFDQLNIPVFWLNPMNPYDDPKVWWFQYKVVPLPVFLRPCIGL